MHHDVCGRIASGAAMLTVHCAQQSVESRGRRPAGGCRNEHRQTRQPRAQAQSKRARQGKGV